MGRLPVTRLSVLAMASLMLMSASCAFASVITYPSPGSSASLRDSVFAPYPERAQNTELAASITPKDLPYPGRENPTDERRPSLWNLIQVALGGSTQSGGNNSVSSKTKNAVCRLATFSCLASDKQGIELFLIDFRFIPDAIPDAREKPPKRSIAG